MPSVFNKYHKNAPPTAIYIGRGSKWGNPFTHIKEGTKAQFVVETREEAVLQYKLWVRERPELIEQIKKELRGQDLVCFCKPNMCHGDVLLEIANEPEFEEVSEATSNTQTSTRKLKWKRGG